MTEFTHPFQRPAVDVSLKQKKKKKKVSSAVSASRRVRCRYLGRRSLYVCVCIAKKRMKMFKLQ